MKFRSLLLAFLLTACANATFRSPPATPAPEFAAAPEQAQQRMCVEEHVGLLRFSRSYLERFCPQIQSQFALICLRFTHTTKDWHKACPGIDTADKLECLSTLANGAGYAQLESLQKCQKITNRAQVYCLSQQVAVKAIPLTPEMVQECIDKNP